MQTTALQAKNFFVYVSGYMSKDAYNSTDKQQDQMPHRCQENLQATVNESEEDTSQLWPITMSRVICLSLRELMKSFHLNSILKETVLPLISGGCMIDRNFDRIQYFFICCMIQYENVAYS